MKKKTRFIWGSTVLIVMITISTIATDNIEPIKGGNGEVLHHSFAESKQKVEKVLEAIYGEKDFVIRLVTKALKAVGARGEDSYAPVRDINISNTDRFIIHADISRAKKPVNCSIPTAIIEQDANFVTLDIDVKDIGDKVILYNRDNQLLLEYKIKK